MEDSTRRRSGLPVVVLIRVYQRLVSPSLGKNCRFQPTCSAYAAEALSLHGLGKGGWLALLRLGKCHPMHEGGYDPVPASALNRAATVSPGRVQT